MDERIVEIKESAISYIVRLEAELPKFVLELRAADTRRLSMLPDVMEGVHWLIEAAMAVTGADGDVIDRLSDALGAMEDAVKNLDYTLIADILEYEILELAADWRGVFE